MQEYVTEAVVLNKEPNGDTDSRVFLFTRDFGKLAAKAKSARKITSKLAAHLEPANLIQVRLVEKNGLQVADALIKKRLAIKPLDLYFLNRLLADAEPDRELFNVIAGSFNWPSALKALGWDPEHALCELCGGAAPAFFYLKDQTFVCGKCSLKFEGNQLIFIK